MANARPGVQWAQGTFIVRKNIEAFLPSFLIIITHRLHDLQLDVRPRPLVLGDTVAAHEAGVGVRGLGGFTQDVPAEVWRQDMCA